MKIVFILSVFLSDVLHFFLYSKVENVKLFTQKSRVKVNEINNYPYVLKEYKTGKGGKLEWQNKEFTTGPIHINLIRISGLRQLWSLIEIDSPGPCVSISFDTVIAIVSGIKITGMHAAPITSPSFKFPS